MENVNKSLAEVIQCIQKSKEYQTCIFLKEKMADNEELSAKINKIKSLQKQYVKNQSSSIKKELDELEEQLKMIPIYTVYLQNLEIVNEKIDFVKDSLNDFFYSLLNL